MPHFQGEVISYAYFCSSVSLNPSWHEPADLTERTFEVLFIAHRREI
jgi:hypothetical protein